MEIMTLPQRGQEATHKTKKTIYIVHGVGQMKVHGEWRDCVHYYGPAKPDHLYSREVDSFARKFSYGNSA